MSWMASALQALGTNFTDDCFVKKFGKPIKSVYRAKHTSPTSVSSWLLLSRQLHMTCEVVRKYDQFLLANFQLFVKVCSLLNITRRTEVLLQYLVLVFKNF